MAARKQLFHPDEVRAKIQASQLINRLQSHAFGEVEMTATQLKAAEVLLKKSIPDLSAVELTGKDGDPIEIQANVSTRDLAKALLGTLEGGQ